METTCNERLPRANLSRNQRILIRCPKSLRQLRKTKIEHSNIHATRLIHLVRPVESNEICEPVAL